MLRQVIEAIELLEDPRTDGVAAVTWVARHGPASVRHQRLEAERGSTDVVTVEIGSGTPCLGILGVLGGTGLRPEPILSRSGRASSPTRTARWWRSPSRRRWRARRAGATRRRDG